MQIPRVFKPVLYPQICTDLKFKSTKSIFHTKAQRFEGVILHAFVALCENRNNQGDCHEKKDD